MEETYFQIEFKYSGKGFIRMKAQTAEDAVEIMKALIAERGAEVSDIISIEEVTSLYPEGMEPEIQKERLN